MKSSSKYPPCAVRSTMPDDLSTHAPACTTPGHAASAFRSAAWHLRCTRATDVKLAHQRSSSAGGFRWGRGGGGDNWRPRLVTPRHLTYTQNSQTSHCWCHGSLRKARPARQLWCAVCGSAQSEHLQSVARMRKPKRAYSRTCCPAQDWWQGAIAQGWTNGQQTTKGDEDNTQGRARGHEGTPQQQSPCAYLPPCTSAQRSRP